MLPTLAQLVAVVTSSNAYQSMLQIANRLGLSTTAWQPLGMANTILATMSEVDASASVSVNLIAQGGYATTAAAMVDATGNPITTWMDLVSSENYNNLRNPAIQAEGPVPFVNSLAVTRGPYAPGTLHLTNPLTGAGYTNQNTQLIVASTTTLVACVADAAYSGTAGTAAIGALLGLSTPIPGVTLAPLGASMVGQDAETNAALLSRDLAKLGAIAPNGAPGAIVYVATTPSIIAQYPDLANPLSPITRAQQILTTSTGTVTVYVANASGAAPTDDANDIGRVLQVTAVPTGMTLLCLPATNLSVVVTATIYVSGSAGTIASEAASAVTEYFSGVPVGGTNGASTGEIPLSALFAAIQAVSPFITEIDISVPSANVIVAAGEVPILDPSSAFTVVVVPL